MKEYEREYPLFSLCGLNCGLCPRYHTGGDSKCPGCGGKDFHLKHPTCAVITCNEKHDRVEYCFQCTSFPCDRYRNLGNKDSFITYRNVIPDFVKAKREGLEQYQAELNEKIGILEFLIKNYNDGKRKNFYCLAVNLLPLKILRSIMNEMNQNIDKQGVPQKDKINRMKSLLEKEAARENIPLLLRK